MDFIKKVPLAISGLALSIAALGNLLLPYGEIVWILCIILSATILSVFLTKVILDFENVMEELKNPAILGVLPTSAMALMLLSAYTKPYLGDLSLYIWYTAIIIHLLIMLLFVKRFVVRFRLETVFPSWFVVNGGFVAASVTSPVMGTIEVGQALFYIGFVTCLIILPILIYRLIKIGPLPEPLRPTIAIFTAPTNLLIAGYLAAFEQPNTLLVYIMLVVAVIGYIYVSINMVSLLRLKFYPTYAAFTFPYVISATAFNAVNVLLVENGYNFFYPAAIISKWIAIVVVVYVLIRYAIFLFSTPRT